MEGPFLSFALLLSCTVVKMNDENITRGIQECGYQYNTCSYRMFMIGADESLTFYRSQQ